MTYCRTHFHWPAGDLRFTWEVEQLSDGDEDGVGKYVRLLTKGWLPYKLSWEFICTEAVKPLGFSLEALGDFTGRGVWKFCQNGKYVDIIYEWRVLANKPILRYLSFLLKPLFAANHRWTMKKGEESLKAEVAHRKSFTDRNEPHD